MYTCMYNPAPRYSGCGLLRICSVRTKPARGGSPSTRACIWSRRAGPRRAPTRPHVGSCAELGRSAARERREPGYRRKGGDIECE